MALPFTRADFLDVFAAYNGVFWPIAVALWVSSAAAALVIARSTRVPHRLISALLAFHWGWSAVAYHAAYFAAINPAAWLFAILFLVQAALFAWQGAIRGQIEYGGVSRGIRRHLATALVIYSLLYPAVNLLDASSDPATRPLAVPLFAVPCPTTLYTVGLLLIAARVGASLIAIPVIWSIVGGSAAVLLGIRSDLVLFVAAGALTFFTMRGNTARTRADRGTRIARPETPEG